MKNKEESYMEAIGQLKTVTVLAKTLEIMASRDKNDLTYIPKNIELIDNIIKVFKNLRRDLLVLLREDMDDNDVLKN
tara:strand:+ start:1865 stop:2095 length:231 start_codon:yes stop_codon:yes gene_type:complete